jgi:hypothetical protein
MTLQFFRNSAFSTAGSLTIVTAMVYLFEYGHSVTAAGLLRLLGL